MSDYPCCECCLTDPLHPDEHEVPCPTCDNPTADRLRAERDALAAELAHMTEARDNARAEAERLSAAVDAVRALHKAGRWYLEECDHPGCEVESVELSAGELYHADEYELVCETCSGGDLAETDDPTPWPCPTIRAIGAES